MTNTPLGAVGLSLKCNVVDEEMIIDHDVLTDKLINASLALKLILATK